MNVLGAGASLVPDLPREALQWLDPALEPWNDLAFQHYVGYAQLLAEERSKGETITLCDKSIIDALAYWNILFGTEAPRWARATEAARYALVLRCDHAGVAADRDSLQGLHLGLRDPLAKRIDEIARDAGVRVVTLSGTRAERLTLALTEIHDLPALAHPRTSRGAGGSGS